MKLHRALNIRTLIAAITLMAFAGLQVFLAPAAYAGKSEAQTTQEVQTAVSHQVAEEQSRQAAAAAQQASMRAQQASQSNMRSQGSKAQGSGNMASTLFGVAAAGFGVGCAGAMGTCSFCCYAAGASVAMAMVMGAAAGSAGKTKDAASVGGLDGVFGGGGNYEDTLGNQAQQGYNFGLDGNADTKAGLTTKQEEYFKNSSPDGAQLVKDLNTAIQQLDAAGVKMDPKGLTLADGTRIDFNNPPKIDAFEGGDIARSLMKDIKAKNASKIAALKSGDTAAAVVAPVETPAAPTKAVEIPGTVKTSGADWYKQFAQGRNPTAAPAAHGKSRFYNGDPIGVAGDDIFQMIRDRYEFKRHQAFFLPQ